MLSQMIQIGAEAWSTLSAGGGWGISLVVLDVVTFGAGVEGCNGLSFVFVAVVCVVSALFLVVAVIASLL